MNFSKAVLKTKFKATGIHLSMSLVVFFILAYQIFFVWYPQPNYLGLIDDFGQGSDYEHWLEKHNRQSDGILVALFRGRYGEVWLVFDRDGKYLGYF
jgi:hypothetical protein